MSAVRRVTVWLGCLAWLSCAAAVAAAQEFEFDIPAQHAPAALNLLGQQSNEQILYLYDEVQGTTTRAVVGTYTLDAAIRQMLDGTDLVVQRNERGVLAVSLSGDHSENEEGGEMESSAKRKTGLLAALATLFFAQR